jgi:D-alanine-D-alanine ligase
MLLEEFHRVPSYDQAVVSYLELMRQPYTGSNPRGLLLARDKALAKTILRSQRIPTPRFAVFPRRRAARPLRRLAYPVFVKSVNEDASLGISQASIVTSDEELLDRVRFVHEKVQSDAIAEQFIEGRELYVGVIGNQRLQTFPVWELVLNKLPEGVARIATRKVKWDEDYQKKYGITTKAAKNLGEALDQRIHKLCKRVYRSLNLSGYARIDLRLQNDGQVYVLEANANPNLAYGEDFAASAHSIGIPYEALLQRIINLGLAYEAPWKG